MFHFRRPRFIVIIIITFTVPVARWTEVTQNVCCAVAGLFRSLIPVFWAGAVIRTVAVVGVTAIYVDRLVFQFHLSLPPRSGYSLSLIQRSTVSLRFGFSNAAATRSLSLICFVTSPAVEWVPSRTAMSILN